VIEHPDRVELLDGDQPVPFDVSDLKYWRVHDRKQLDAVRDRNAKPPATPNSRVERAIPRGIDEPRGKMLVVIIAHRLATVHNADQVAVFDQASDRQ
jgi:hypothetical protein